MLIVIAVLIVLGILIFRVRDIRDRWFQPMLICTPVLLIAVLQERLDPVRVKGILVVAALAAMLVCIFIPSRILLAERFHRTEPLNRPFDRLAQKLSATVGDVPVIVTDTRLLAGNLRLNLADKTCLVPELAPLFMQPGQRYALAWEATQNTNPPRSLVAFAVARGSSDLTNTPAEYFSATFEFHQRRQMRIGVIVPREGRELARDLRTE